MTTSDRIKEILKEKGWTQQDLANRLTKPNGDPVNLRTVKNTLGRDSMTVENLRKYAEALGVPVWQLLVTPTEIMPMEPVTQITCPHCGKFIGIDLNVHKA